MSDRYSEYRQVAHDLNVDALALVPGSNFTRLFDASFHSHERPLLILIPVAGPPAALVPNLELRSFDLLDFEGEVFDWRDQDGYEAAFAALAQAMPLKTLAVEGQIMRVFVHHALKNAYPDIEIRDAERAISQLRMVKSPRDIEKMLGAIEISERALARVLPQVRVGQTEKQVEQMLVQALFGEGAEDMAFGPIVAAGDNSARPHAHARQGYQIQPGDALLFDFGARHSGFCADITRTVFVGEPSGEARDVYDTVLSANLRGLEITKAGVTAHEIDDAVTGVLEQSPFADRIRTKTGHGLGRDVHEAPYIMRGNHQPLPAGTVFTNEPGLYKIGAFGVRIEDDVLVTETGYRTLTSFPKELTVVGQ